MELSASLRQILSNLCALTLLTLALHHGTTQLAHALPPSAPCAALLDTYHTKHHKEAAPWTGENMVYFLHVPRTAGRTFHSCMLKMGTHPKKRCPRAYDHLRLNMSVPNCQLLSSHDDFSVVSLLPGNTAVLTHIRDPVDRFLSAYEFAIEVSSRQAVRGSSFRKKAKTMATEDVWPWSYLIPFFAEDIRQRAWNVRKTFRVEKPGNWVYVKHPDGSEFFYNKAINRSKWNLTQAERELLLPPLDMYDNPLVMPLREFMRHPIAHELLHNGGSNQVLGITNYSHWGDAKEMRACMLAHEDIRNQMLEVAKARIHRFSHVGTTDRLWDSAVAAAASFDFPLDGPAYASSEDGATGQQLHSEGNYTAKDLPQLGVRVRDSKVELMKLQKQLFEANQVAKSESELVDLKELVSQARMRHRKDQEVLVTLKASLPEKEDKGAAAKPDVLPENGRTEVKMLSGHLGIEFQRCANRAQERNLERRDGALRSLAMPDARGVFFSKAVRGMISNDILDYLREVNPVDTALHQTALEELETRRANFAANGKLGVMPKLPPPQPRVPVGPAKQVKFHIPKPKGDYDSAEL